MNGGDQRLFLLIRNPCVPLPPASTPARPLPAITGPARPKHQRHPRAEHRPPRAHGNAWRQALTPAPPRRGRGPRHAVLAHGRQPDLRLGPAARAAVAEPLWTGSGRGRNRWPRVSVEPGSRPLAAGMPR